MKKISLLLTVFCVLLASGAAAAQEARTDFSGNWEINIVRSKLPEEKRVEPTVLVVGQTDEELMVETIVRRAAPPQMTAQMDASGGMRPDGNRAARRPAPAVNPVAAAEPFNTPGTLTYNLAGNTVETTGETPAGAPSSVVTLSAVFEKDGRLRLNQSSKITGAGGSEMTTKTTETWELADGGQTLKITRETLTARGTQTAELFFARSEAANFTGAATPIGISNAGISSATLEQVNGTDAPRDINAGADKSLTGFAVAPRVIAGGVLNSKALQMPKPALPPAARAVRASGAVNVQVTVNESGSVVTATAVSGHPLLRAAAAEAARAAKFAPVLVEGIPSKVTGVLTYNFNL